MKLWYADASPYARKVRILLRELGLADRVTEQAVATTPIAPNEDLAKVSPLVRVPTLETDEGEALYDSRVICEYLESLNGDQSLTPANGTARWRDLRDAALAEGILDTAVGLRYEMALKEERFQDPNWIEARRQRILQALDAMESDAPEIGAAPSQGNISWAAALGYLDLRFADMNWREGRPKLAAWYERFSQRPSLVETAPK